MSSEIQWLIGVAVSLAIFYGGIFWGAYRGVMAKFDTLSKSVRDGDDALHERINRTRDDYVRRVDFNDQLSRLEGGMKELREDVRKGQEEERQGRREMMQLLQSAVSTVLNKER